MIGRTLVCGIVAALGVFWCVGSAFAAPPANDNFANAEVLSGSTDTASGTNVEATEEGGEPDHAGDPGGASVWYRWTAPSSGKFRIDTCDSDFPTLLGVYSGSAVNALTPVASNAGGCGGLSRVIFEASAGTTYQIAVDGDTSGGPPATGNVVLDLRPASPPPNDQFANAEALTGVSVAAGGSTLDATGEAGEPVHDGIPGGASIWYRWTPPSVGTVQVTERVTIHTCNSGFDTLLAVYTGGSIGGLSYVASNDDSASCPDAQSSLTFTAVQGTTYWIAVDGFLGDEGGVSLRLLDSYSFPLPALPIFGTTASIGKLRVNSAKRTVTVHFSANVPASFKCRLDGGPGVPCTSPFTFGPRNSPPKELRPGVQHAVTVIARHRFGHESSEAVRTFRFKKVKKRSKKRRAPR